MAEAEEVVREVQAKMRAEGQAAFRPAFQEFFDANPEVEAIRWIQHTPYFNDGDECVFRLYDICVEFTGDFRSKHMRSDFDVTRMSKSESWYEGDAWYVNKDSVDGQAALARFNKFANDIRDKALFEAVFGDHVKVEVTRAGINVIDDEDHD